MVSTASYITSKKEREKRKEGDREREREKKKRERVKPSLRWSSPVGKTRKVYIAGSADSALFLTTYVLCRLYLNTPICERAGATFFFLIYLSLTMSAVYLANMRTLN